MRYTLLPADAGAPVELPQGDAVRGGSGRVWQLGPEPLGSGAQASVWPAVGEDGSRVAVKLAHETAGARTALRAEADLLCLLHEAGFSGAVACLDRVDDGGRVGFVMPLYPMDLEAYAPTTFTGPRAIEAVLGLASALARALADLHAVVLPGRDGHIVHRDVKPENVLVDAAGRLHLADLAGSLVVDRPVSLALGVFGSPMWAPFDQMLPGLPEPNPTWDTYAVGVILFWWITGGRPEFQADPSPMLTERGRATWSTLRAMAAGEGDFATSYAALSAARLGTRAADLVDVRGHAAIQDGDRAAIREGVTRLGAVAVYGEAALADASQSLADLLARALSPLSHPSPPNRYWRAGELAQQIDAIQARLVSARVAKARPPPRRSRLVWVLAAGMMMAMFAGIFGLAVWWAWPAPVGPLAGPDVVVIPAGTTTHGDIWGDGEADERPTRAVTLPSFRMSRTEVSHRSYRACVDLGVCTPLSWTTPGFLSTPAGAPYVGNTGDDQPAVGVTWQQALTWCAWAGGRLPTEEEWEKAATSPTGNDAGGPKRRWPWGDTAADCTRANFRDCGVGHTLPVDALPAGSAPAGAVQLVGNVWEWTSSSYPVVKRALFNRKTLAHKVLRGGSFTSASTAMRPTFRRHAAPEEVSEQYGFRCVLEGAGP